MKFIFYYEFIEGVKTIQRIKKPLDSKWFHFSRNHWGLENHCSFIQNKIREKKFASFRQISITLPEDLIAFYFNVLTRKFEFKCEELIQGKFLILLLIYYYFIVIIITSKVYYIKILIIQSL